MEYVIYINVELKGIDKNYNYVGNHTLLQNDNVLTELIHECRLYYKT